ncbi:TFC3 [Candida pseudojiufengensis]|uniref:TFC3 n=1 Tax=Candida pseudojiufengensis TaxID=497109 RepID=UPI002224FF33|nr:TFC3 [Candida pseudojiufengensis]KAI5962099.1 TFC3 [Candida pseudojiufengensis]
MSQFPYTPFEIAAFVAEKLSFSGFKGLLLTELWSFIQEKFNQELELDDFQKQIIWNWLFFELRDGKNNDEDIKFYITYDKDPVTIESSFESFLNKQENPENLRVLPTDETQVSFLTGVSNNKKYISTLGAFPYQLLQEIARHGSKGTWASDLTYATGQDNRSMTGRLNKLEEAGLITKESKFYTEKNHHSTWVVHYKFAGSTGLNNEIEDNSSRSPTKLKEFIMNKLKEAENNIRIFRDLKVEMNMHKTHHCSKLFGAVTEKLVDRGYIERINVADQDQPGRHLYALRMLKELPTQNQDDITETLEVLKQSEEINNEFDEEQEDEENSTVVTFTDLFPIQTQMFYTIKSSGKYGITAKNALTQLLGGNKHKICSRLLELDVGYLLKDGKLEPLVDYPEEDMRTALVKQSESEGKVKFYRYYAKENNNGPLMKTHKKTRTEKVELRGTLQELEKKHFQKLESTVPGALLPIPEFIKPNTDSKPQVETKVNKSTDSKPKKETKVKKSKKNASAETIEDSEISNETKKETRGRKRKNASVETTEDPEISNETKKETRGRKRKEKASVDTTENPEVSNKPTKRKKTKRPVDVDDKVEKVEEQPRKRPKRTTKKSKVITVEDEDLDLDKNDEDLDLDKNDEEFKLDENEKVSSKEVPKNSSPENVENGETIDDIESTTEPTSDLVKPEPPLPLDTSTTIEPELNTENAESTDIKSNNMQDSTNSYTPKLKNTINTKPRSFKQENSKLKTSDITSDFRREKFIELIKELGGITFTSAKLSRELSKKLNPPIEPDQKTISRDLKKLKDEGKLEIQAFTTLQYNREIKRNLIILTIPEFKPSDSKIEEFKKRSLNDSIRKERKELKIPKVDESYVLLNSKENLKRNGSRLDSLDVSKVAKVNKNTKKQNPKDNMNEFEAFISGEPIYENLENFEAGIISKGNNKSTQRAKAREQQRLQNAMLDNYPTQFELDDATSLFRSICICKTFDKISIDFEEIAKTFNVTNIKTIKRLWTSIRRQIGGMSAINKGIEDFEKIVSKGINEGIVRLKHLKKIELPFFLHLWSNSDASKIEIKDKKPLYNSMKENMKIYKRKQYHENFNSIFDQIENESMKQKEEILVNTPFYIKKKDAKDLKPNPLDEIKSTIKSIIRYAEQEELNKYENILSKFDSKDVAESYKQLLEDGEIMNLNEENNDTTINKLRITEKCYNGLLSNQLINQFFKESSHFEDKINDIILQKKGLIISPLIEEGSLAKFINLIIHNKISIMHIDKKSDYFGYESRSMDKGQLDCDLITFKKKEEGSEAVEENESIKNIPVPLNQPCSYLWIDINGSIDVDLWKQILSTILYIINFHPGITKSIIYNKLKYLITISEFEIVLNWLIKSNVLKVEGSGIWIKSNFLNILGSE